MCLILFAYRAHPRYPLIIAANRDEFYHRATKHAHWWPESGEFLAGQDLEAGGTWMGIARDGKFAAVTNVREPNQQPAQYSRGLLPQYYLQNGAEVQQFIATLEKSRDSYQGYNLLFGNSEELYFFSNRGKGATLLNPGVYGLSNAQLNTPWPKVISGKKLLQQQLKKTELSSEKLLDILSSTKIADDSQLPKTGISHEWERRLSAIKISAPEYGTRSSTALSIDLHGDVTFRERTLAPESGEDALYQFRIN